MTKSPLQFALEPLRKYSTFSGRASRAEFWWYSLAIVVLVAVLWFGVVRSALIAAANNGQATTLATALFGGVGLFAFVAGLAVILPTVAVQVRRLHDTGRSGWWVGGYYLLYLVYVLAALGLMGAMASGAESAASTGLVMLIGLLGLAIFAYFVVLLVFFILPGTKGPNRYGPDPYGADLGEVFR